jgi:hypothetical protein
MSSFLFAYFHEVLNAARSLTDVEWLLNSTCNEIKTGFDRLAQFLLLR